jgi:secreted PhoX family phosphatase
MTHSTINVPEPDADDLGVNLSREPTLADLIEARMSRRTALKGLIAAGAYGLFGCTGTGPRATGGDAPLTFTESGRFLDETHHVAPGYDVQVLIRWGDPLHRTGPRFAPGRQTAAEQEAQFGFNNDFVAFMPLPAGSTASSRGLLCVNHEYTSSHLFWPGVTAGNALGRMSRRQCETEMAAQGHTIIEIERSAEAWRLVDGSPRQRRISARSTPMLLAGPAAGHPRLRTRADASGSRVVGTFANCAGGVTPWGTVLSAEENFNYYFTGNAAQGPEAAARKRYGVHGRALNAWGRHIGRFDLDREPNEPNRFGWVVEIDPYDPASTPVKRTALGRFKHESASIAVSHDGRIAVYSGDDEAFEYVYKFVTRRAYTPGHPAANRDLLDDGTLYVAKFEANGMMRWMPLAFGQGPLTAAHGFASQADVVIEARRAADLIGATPMDRPEDIEVHSVTGRVYVVLTYNERRTAQQADAANPRGPNRYGHIIEIAPPLVNGRADHAATECAWEFFLLAGNPADPEHGARYHARVSASGWLACPDNLALDPAGRLWIATDGQDDVMDVAESLYAAQTTGEQRGATRCLFNGPRGAELTGPAFTPDGTTLFLAIQHPAAEKGSTFDQPSTRWPDFTDGVPPRPSVIAITKADGGEIGS